jgi:hypothetical protein
MYILFEQMIQSLTRKPPSKNRTSHQSPTTCFPYSQRSSTPQKLLLSTHLSKFLSSISQYPLSTTSWLAKTIVFFVLPYYYLKSLRHGASSKSSSKPCYIDATSSNCLKTRGSFLYLAKHYLVLTAFFVCLPFVSKFPRFS